jgi:SAM-dependent methyltransferase
VRDSGGSASVQRELWGARARDWADVQEPTALPLYEHVISGNSVGNGHKLLDIGCGSGLFCSMAAKRGSAVTGFDATPALIDIAKLRIPHGSFHVGDMEALPFSASTFHIVTGFNSFQYAANPLNALTEARRVAQPNATFVIAVWGKAEDCQAAAYLAAIGKLLPPPPPGAPGPFALSDDAALRKLVTDAGMTPVEVKDVDCPWLYADDCTALRGLLSAGPAVKAIHTSGEDHVREAVLRALEPFRTESGAYRLENKFRYVVARA